MATLTIDQSSVGITIANSGTLKTLTFTRVPTRSPICMLEHYRLDLVDDSRAGYPPRSLFGCHIPSSWYTAAPATGVDGTVNSPLLISGQSIPFENLTVLSCPPGSQFTIEIQ
jgi:hypothetical protein